MVRHFGILWGAVVALAACFQQGEPLTPGDRCAMLCTPPAGHPCAGEEVPSTCESSCVAHIENLVDECLTCVMRNSGWIGQACECTEVDEFGNIDVQCDDCAYTTFEKACTDGIASGTCAKDGATCSGFELVATNGLCATACGG